MIRRLLLLLLMLPATALAQSGTSGGVRTQGTVAANDCVKFVSKNVITSAGAACGTGSGSGTVTSVSFTGGLISVATPTTTPAFTVAGTSGGIPFFDSASTWNTSALLASNSPILGGGAGATPKTATFLTTNGSSELDIGVVGGGNGVLGLKGNTSGTATFTAPAVAGTATNNVVMTNGLSGPDGAASTPTYSFANSPGTGLWQTGNFAVLGSSGTQMYFQTQAASKFFINGNNFDPFVSGTQGLGESTQVYANIFTNKYSTGTNCSSGASPAVCGSAAAGSVAVPTGTNATLQVNTTAVTASSTIFLQSDETLGTKLSVTCNTTLASVIVEPVITARSAGSSFTITISGTTTTNPVCLNYFIVN